MFQLKSLTSNDITRTGFLLGGLGGILVLILALLNHVTADPIKKAQEAVEKRARSKVFQNAYVHYELPSKQKFKTLVGEAIHMDESKDRVANQSHYDSMHKTLAYLGLMSKEIKGGLDQLLDNPKYKEAIQQLYDKTKDLNSVRYTPTIYIIEKYLMKMGSTKEKKESGAFPIFKDVINPQGFDLLEKKDVIIFTVNQGDKSSGIDGLNLKAKPITISKIQYDKLKERFKDKKLKMISYHEAYIPGSNSQKAKLMGKVVKFSAPNGYGGNIGMLIGFDRENKITGYRMIEHNETPGLGVKANNNPFIAAFIGKEPKKMPRDKKEYMKELGINSIAGATITSLAVTNGIRMASSKLDSLKELEQLGEGQDNGENVDTASDPAINGEEVPDDKTKEAQLKADQLKAAQLKAAQAKAAKIKAAKAAQARRQAARRNGTTKSGVTTYIQRTRGSLIPPTNTKPVSERDPKDQNAIDSLFKNKSN